MTDEHDPQMLSSSSSSFRYEVAPYRAPGTFAVPRLLVCLLTVVLLAFGLGWCVHWLDTWLEKIEWAWTLGLGFAMGLLGATAVHAARVRHGGLAALLGLVGGGLCLVAMHYWKYRDTLPVYDDRARAWAVEVVAADLAARANLRICPGCPDQGRRLPVWWDWWRSQLVRRHAHQRKLVFPGLYHNGATRPLPRQHRARIGSRG